MTISASTVIKVNNTGATLTPGVHPLIAAATTGNLGQVTGTLPSVVVTGNSAPGSNFPQIDDAGKLNLVVATSINATSVKFTPGMGMLTLTWPVDHLGWVARSNAVGLANSNFWFDILGSQSTTNLIVPVNPAAPPVFYRLRYPF